MLHYACVTGETFSQEETRCRSCLDTERNQRTRNTNSSCQNVVHKHSHHLSVASTLLFLQSRKICSKKTGNHTYLLLMFIANGWKWNHLDDTFVITITNVCEDNVKSANYSQIIIQRTFLCNDFLIISSFNHYFLFEFHQFNYISLQLWFIANCSK